MRLNKLYLLLILPVVITIIACAFLPVAKQSSTFIIHRGESINKLAHNLKSKHLILETYSIKLLLKIYVTLGNSIAAGEYYIPRGASLFDIINIIDRKQFVLRKVTIPEGLTRFRILNILTAQDGLWDDKTDLPPEGHLMPDSYIYVYGDHVGKILSTMYHSMEQFLAEQWASRSGDALLLKDARQALILASIVDKETAVDAEKSRIAQVYFNRLKRDMPLQADPTVIYGITEGRENLGRRLTYKDLKHDSPYNTYTRKGLPAAPIANPGRISILSTLHPKFSNELYFVARGDGTHAFATNYAQHLHNVLKYKKLRRQLLSE